MGLYYILSSLTGRDRRWVRLLQLDAAEQCSHVGDVLWHVGLHAEGVLAIGLLDDVFGLTLLGDIKTLPCQRSGTTVSLRWYKNTTAPVQLYQRGGNFLVQLLPAASGTHLTPPLRICQLVNVCQRPTDRMCRFSSRANIIS